MAVAPNSSVFRRVIMTLALAAVAMLYPVPVSALSPLGSRSHSYSSYIGGMGLGWSGRKTSAVTLGDAYRPSEVSYFSEQPRWIRRSQLENAESMNPKIPTTPSSSSNSMNSFESVAHFSDVRRIPLMPIQDQLVYPAGEVPLKIYEKRYRHMVDDLSKEGADRIFGLVMSNKVGDICEVGTGLEVMNVKSLEDGRQLVGTASRQRFRILRLVQEEPYMVAEVEYGLIDSDVYAASDKNSGSYADGELPKHLCELEREVEANVNDVLSLLNKLIEIEAAKSRARVPRMKPSQLSSSAEMLAPSKHLFRLQVATDYSFAISNTIGGSPLVRQLLLESPTLELRLRRLRQVLLRERNFLLQQVSEGATEAFN